MQTRQEREVNNVFDMRGNQRDGFCLIVGDLCSDFFVVGSVIWGASTVDRTGAMSKMLSVFETF